MTIGFLQSENLDFHNDKGMNIFQNFYYKIYPDF